MISQTNYSQLDPDAFLLKLDSILAPPEVTRGSASLQGDVLRSRDDSAIHRSQCIGVRKRDDDDSEGWGMKRVFAFRDASQPSYASGSHQMETGSPWASFDARSSNNASADHQDPRLRTSANHQDPRLRTTGDMPLPNGTGSDTDGDHAASIMHLTLTEISDKILTLNRQIAQDKDSEEVGRIWKIRAEKAESDLLEARTALTALEDRRLEVEAARSQAETKLRNADVTMRQMREEKTAARVATELQADDHRKAELAASQSHLASHLAHERKVENWELARRLAEKRQGALEAEKGAEVKKRKEAESKVEKAASEAAEAKKGQKLAEGKLAQMKKSHMRTWRRVTSGSGN